MASADPESPRSGPAGPAGPIRPVGRFRLARVGFGDPDATRLMAQVQAEYVERYGSPDETPLDPLMFDPPHGSFFVGHLTDPDGTEAAIATGAWRRCDVEAFGAARTVEIKRMYVVREARRRGLSRVVLAHLEATAVEAGAEAIVLETGTLQPEAIALYESAGYTIVPGFGYYRDAPESRYYGKDLRVGLAISTPVVPGEPEE